MSLLGSLPIRVSPGRQPEQPTDREPTIVGLEIGLSLLPPSLDLFAIAIVPNSRDRARARHQDPELTEANNATRCMINLLLSPPFVFRANRLYQ